MTEELSAKEQKELEDRKLENTLQYGKAMENPESTETPQETEQEKDPVWKSFPIDPATGYRKDPNTGELLDPDTGDPINSTMKVIDF